MLFSRLLPLLAAASLLAGCQSSRSGFSFRPAPRAVALENSVAPAGPAATEIAPTAATPFAKSSTNQPVAAQSKIQASHLTHRLARGLAAWQPAPLARLPPAARHRQPKPQAPAEVGLGTTVLGVLGLVVLPIALLGLLLSGGGLVWGVVAGLAALAVLVAKLDPFG